MVRGVLALALGLCGASVHAESYTVTLSSDLADANPGDGICSGLDDPSPGASACTLRAAIQEANLDPTPGRVTILLARGETYALAIAGAVEHSAASGDLDILRPVELVSIGSDDAPRARIHADGLDRVLHLGPQAFGSRVSGVELRGGWAADGRGVAVLIDARTQPHLADIVFEDVLVRDNGAPVGHASSAACAIELGGDVGVRVIRSEIHDNGAAGICVDGSAFLAVEDVSIRGNLGGVVIANDGKQAATFAGAQPSPGCRSTPALHPGAAARCANSLEAVGEEIDALQPERDQPVLAAVGAVLADA